ncbi:MAG: glycosyltransferase [Patescibacteria group bacterium]
MKIAVVHDDFIQKGGAEKLVLALLEVCPEADLYTSIISRSWGEFFAARKIRFSASFMQKLPWVEKLFRFYFPLYPLAFESFNFDGYDLVISSSARFAHGIITKPGTVHIAYINSPGRMFWEPDKYFERLGRLRKIILTPLLSYLRIWDFTSARRPDYLVANSRSASGKIEKYWGMSPAAVIYPFSESNEAASMGSPRQPRTSAQVGDGYYLVISRLNRWKRIDLAIEACNELHQSLVIIGEGPERKFLEKMSGPLTEFKGYIRDQEKWEYIRGCKALIQTQKEDFGITALEAQLVGKPVIAYGQGGSLETVIEGKTGMFFSAQTKESLIEALGIFNESSYLSSDCVKQADNFSKERFLSAFNDLVYKSAFDRRNKQPLPNP